MPDNLTNFAALTQDEKKVWSRDLWTNAREKMFLSRLMGGTESPVQEINELTTTEKGDKVIMHLLADLKRDGIAGDATREGREEAMRAYTDEIQIDLISHGVRDTGKMANQRTIVSMREHARDHLSYWLANRIDQLAVHTLSGIDTNVDLNGKVRNEQTFNQLAFNSDIRAPSANRHVRIDASGTLQTGDTSFATPADKLTYGSLVDLAAFADTEYMRPLAEGGGEYYVLWMHPLSYAQLKKDPDFQRAIITAGPRDLDKNPWFKGGIVTVDGLVIQTSRMIYNNHNAATPDQWGAAGDVTGTRALLLGAQALGMARLGSPEWVEKKFNYDTQLGINVDQMIGFVKPQYENDWLDDGAQKEDFGVIAVDHAYGG